MGHKSHIDSSVGRDCQDLNAIIRSTFRSCHRKPLKISSTENVESTPRPTRYLAQHVKPGDITITYAYVGHLLWGIYVRACMDHSTFLRTYFDVDTSLAWTPAPLVHGKIRSPHTRRIWVSLRARPARFSQRVVWESLVAGRPHVNTWREYPSDLLP
jgi:hypothetical protein